jgi:hypothetical protein
LPHFIFKFVDIKKFQTSKSDISDCFFLNVPTRPFRGFPVVDNLEIVFKILWNSTLLGMLCCLENKQCEWLRISAAAVCVKAWMPLA